MKIIHASLLILLLTSLSIPARADFKYTDTTKITGGAMVGMAKFAGIFSKASKQALQPVTTTHYVKGNRIRVDNADGTVQIIDLDGRRIIEVDNQKKIYSVITFDQMKAALEQMQQKLQQVQQTPQSTAKPQNPPQVTVTPKIKVLPGSGNRVILGQPTNETKIEMDIEMQAQGGAGAPAPPAAPTPGQSPDPNSVTMAMTLDTWVAPSVAGYEEFGQFYQRMAKEVNWVPPSNLHIDPRMSQGMAELQKNSAALKGLPMLSYVTMGLPGLPGQPANADVAHSQGSSQASSSANSGGPNASEGIPTSASAIMAKGLGGLFGKKKQKNNSASQSSADSAPPENSNPNALMEMTTEVASFSDSSLDSSLFEIPAGYARVEKNPGQILDSNPKH